jgi:hypothetical protein
LPPGTSLVQTLIQLGPDITSDPDTVRALLQRFGILDANPPQDAQLVEITSNLARLAAEGTTLCDVGALVRALSSFVRVSLTSLASRQEYLNLDKWLADNVNQVSCTPVPKPAQHSVLF